MSYDPETDAGRKPQIGIPAVPDVDFGNSDDILAVLGVRNIGPDTVPTSLAKVDLLSWFMNLDGGLTETDSDDESLQVAGISIDEPNTTTVQAPHEVAAQPAFIAHERRLTPAALPKFILESKRPNLDSPTLNAVLKTICGLNDERVALMVAMAGLRPKGITLEEVAEVIKNSSGSIGLTESEIADKLSEMVDYRITPLGIGSIDQSVRKRLDQRLVLSEKGFAYAPTATLLLSASTRLPLVAIRDIFVYGRSLPDPVIAQRYVTLRALVETKQGNLIPFPNESGNEALLRTLRDTGYVRAVPSGREKLDNLPQYAVRQSPRSIRPTTPNSAIRRATVDQLRHLGIGDPVDLLRLLDYQVGSNMSPVQARAIVIDELEKQVKAGIFRHIRSGTFRPRNVQITEEARHDGLRGLLDVVDATATNHVDPQIAADVLGQILADPRSIRRPIELAYKKTRSNAVLDSR